MVRLHLTSSSSLGFVLLSSVGFLGACGSSGHAPNARGAAGIAGTALTPSGGQGGNAGVTSGGAGSGVTANGGATAAGGGSAGSNSALGGAGGESPVAAGAGAGSSLAGSSARGMSKAEACIAYTAAACKRRSECLSTLSDCFQATSLCPDVVFLPGSTRTVEDLLACADAYATLSCDAIRYDQLPTCVTPGTLAAGEACSFSPQCASLECTGSPCGTCAKSVGLGESCITAGVTCALGLYCGPKGQCASPPDPNAPPKLLGGTCATIADCPDDSFCQIPSGSMAGVCTAYPGVGESCSVGLTCDSASYCSQADLVCHALPEDGAPCGVDAFTGRASYCAAGLICHLGATRSAGTCGAFQAEGEPCLVYPDDGTVNSISCAKGLFCDTTVMPALCTAPGAAGAPCHTAVGDAACVSDYSCECVDAACTAGACVHLGRAGDPCDDDAHCHPAFACTGGVCVPRDSQGLADACPQ
jgi:hypothetical protein